MDSDNDLSTAFFGFLLSVVTSADIIIKRRRRPRQRRFWMRYWLLRRETECRGLLNDFEAEIMLEDEDYFKSYLRMGDREFNLILTLVFDSIAKMDTVLRPSIAARKRLAITLRYLATGETFESIGLSCRVARNTIGRMVKETLDAIITSLGPIYLQPPSTTEEWEKIADDFYKKWGFPNCMGALDGKHIGFRPSRTEAAYYHNYKGFQSIVLLALVDADKKFLTVDIGANGRVSDGGVWAKSRLHDALLRNDLNVPERRPLPGRRLKVPLVKIADNAFPLDVDTMKPYVGNSLTAHQIAFNKRLSSARNVVENAFGLLANRFKVLLVPINNSNPDFVTKVTHACCILHNFLMTETIRTYSDLREEDNHVLVGLEDINPRLDVGSTFRVEFLRFFNDLP